MSLQPIRPSTIDTTAREDTTEGHIVLENRFLRIALDRHNGGIVAIDNKPRELRLNQHHAGAAPWRIELVGAEAWIERFTAFRYHSAPADQAGQWVDLVWETSEGLAVEARVELAHDAPNARFFVAVTPGDAACVDKIEYPIVRGIGDLGDPAASRLMHAQGTGFLFHDPYHLFEAGHERRQGLRYSPYPEGFNGSPMQCMAYYVEGRGGFYLAAHDSGGAMKWLNFFKHDDALASTVIHQMPEIGPGKPFRVAYPVLIGALFEGDWYEAADRYKAWATQQPWTAQGPLWRRDERATWLLDEVGLATFGVNAGYDRAAWLAWFHAAFQRPIFHILGPNWPKAGADYRNNLPGGYDDWFPARVSETNVAAIRANGDYFALFEFDLLLSAKGADGAAVAAAHTVLPEPRYSFDRYTFPFTCPATTYLPALHRWRDETLAAVYDVDALYYDISANNVLMACRSAEHGHPVGGGGWMVGAYAAMYRATKAAAGHAKESYVPQGAEMVNELFIPNFDFYQARAVASPLSCFEADFFVDWIKARHAEKIPLFEYVYHEYGPVRLDGWAKLAPEAGELFYWVAARVALWGGLLELNYEFSPLETLDGQCEQVAEHYADIEPHAFAVDPAKVEFVREVAAARTGFAKDYLVYGTMARPIAFDTAEVELDYLLYNTIKIQRPRERETLRVPAVIHAAWRAPDGRLGLLFVNLHTDDLQELEIRLDLERYGFAPDQAVAAELVMSGERMALGSLESNVALTLNLPARRIVLLEIDAPGGASRQRRVMQ
jgi:hypothetical protein